MSARDVRRWVKCLPASLLLAAAFTGLNASPSQALINGPGGMWTYGDASITRIDGNVVYYADGTSKTVTVAGTSTEKAVAQQARALVRTHEFPFHGPPSASVLDAAEALDDLGSGTYGRKDRSDAIRRGFASLAEKAGLRQSGFFGRLGPVGVLADINYGVWKHNYGLIKQEFGTHVNNQQWGSSCCEISPVSAGQSLGHGGVGRLWEKGGAWVNNASPTYDHYSWGTRAPVAGFFVGSDLTERNHYTGAILTTSKGAPPLTGAAEHIALPIEPMSPAFGAMSGWHWLGSGYPNDTRHSAWFIPWSGHSNLGTTTNPSATTAVGSTSNVSSPPARNDVQLAADLEAALRTGDLTAEEQLAINLAAVGLRSDDLGVNDPSEDHPDIAFPRKWTKWGDHQEQFPDFDDADDYWREGVRIIRSGDQEGGLGDVFKCNSRARDGATTYWDSESNTLVIVKNGKIETIFKPDDGREYFDADCARI